MNRPWNMSGMQNVEDHLTAVSHTHPCWSTFVRTSTDTIRTPAPHPTHNYSKYPNPNPYPYPKSNHNHVKTLHWYLCEDHPRCSQASKMSSCAVESNPTPSVEMIQWQSNWHVAIFFFMTLFNFSWRWYYYTSVAMYGWWNMTGQSPDFFVSFNLLIRWLWTTVSFPH